MPSSQQQPANSWLIAGAMILPTFMVALDTSVANVALPSMAASLSATAHQTTAVLTGYLVANAIVLPATGWLAQYFGRKRFLIANIVLFTLASIVCGMAWSLPVMVVARVVQGASGGALLPVTQAVVLESFAPALRGEAMASWGLGVIVAPIIGPTLGGWITDSYSWRWLFYINVPVGIVAIVLAQMLVHDPAYLRNAGRRSIDYFGFCAMAVGLGSLQILLDSGQRHHWFATPWIRWAAIISALALGAFFLRERRVRQPVVDLGIVRDRNFGCGLLLGGVYGFILYASLVMLPLFLQGLMASPVCSAERPIRPCRKSGNITRLA
ncbi:MAG: DHA2 family efflux MFS transporter permease subunit [Hyphomicrobiaceae bacterium]